MVTKLVFEISGIHYLSILNKDKIDNTTNKTKELYWILIFLIFLTLGQLTDTSKKGQPQPNKPMKKKTVVLYEDLSWNPQFFRAWPVIFPLKFFNFYHFTTKSLTSLINC